MGCQADLEIPGGGLMVRPDHLWLPTRADYALRALIELTHAAGSLTTDAIATAQSIPRTFLSVILSQLGRAELVKSRRGRSGGYTLARSPEEISVAEVVRAVEDAPVTPDEPPNPASSSRALRGSLVGLLETVSVASIARGDVPDHVRQLAGLARPRQPGVSRTPTPP